MSGVAESSLFCVTCVDQPDTAEFTTHQPLQSPLCIWVVMETALCEDCNGAGKINGALHSGVLGGGVREGLGRVSCHDGLLPHIGPTKQSARGYVIIFL